LTERLLKEYKKRIRSMTLVPSGGGVFEVTVDGRLVYSKKERKRFPEYGEVKAAIDGMESERGGR
jgi:selenoprotein W-related protein